MENLDFIKLADDRIFEFKVLTKTEVEELMNNNNFMLYPYSTVVDCSFPMSKIYSDGHSYVGLYDLKHLNSYGLYCKDIYFIELISKNKITVFSPDDIRSFVYQYLTKSECEKLKESHEMVLLHDGDDDKAYQLKDGRILDIAGMFGGLHNDIENYKAFLKTIGY